MLPPILLAAVAAGVLFPAPGTYRYSASLGAQRIGEWTVSVKPNGADTEVDENSSASVAGMQLSATATLVLGADLAPTKYTGSYRTPGQSPTPSVSLTPAAATVTGTVTATAPQQLSLLAGTRHFVVIEPGLLAGLFVLPAQLDAWKETQVTWITPATGGAQLLAANPAAPTSAPAGVPPQDAVLSIDRPVVVTIWYDPATLVPDEVSVPSQNAVLIRER
jgi:hypothetical protein